MPQPPFRSRRRAAATLDAVLDLLKRLARGRAWIAVADIDAGRAVHIRTSAAKGDAAPPVASVAVAEAMRQGWIGPLADESRLGLTRDGRTVLRRAMSRLADSRAASSRTGGGTAPKSAPPAAHSVNAAESPIAWLRSRRDASGQPILTEPQYLAGEQLRTDLTIAGLTPRVTMAWTGLPGGGSGLASNGSGRDVADNVAFAQARVMRALTAVGPEAAGLLIDVCGHLKGLREVAESEGWPRRSAKLVLLQALTALARHYGLLPVVPAERTLRERLRHWGAADYRPSLDRWEGGAGEEDVQPD